MPVNRLISISLLVVLILSVHPLPAQVSPGDDDILFRWRYSLNNDVTSLKTDRINNNSAVLVASANTLHVLDRAGNLTGEYTLQTPGGIYAIEVGDVDGDGEDEILLGVGWMETEEIADSELYSLYEGIPEEEDLLYRILKSRGSLYVIDDGGVSKWDEVDQWVRSIIISDVNGDDREEVVVVAGGGVSNYFKRYTDVVYLHRYCWTEYDTKYTDYDEVECTCTGCFWDNESELCFQEVASRVCDWNETIDKGWNFSESSSVNGSIIVFDKTGNLILRSDMTDLGGTFWSAGVSNLHRDRDEEIIVGSGSRLIVFTHNGTLQSCYDVLGDVRNINFLDVNKDGNDDILFSFENQSSDISGIEVVSREGVELLSYRMEPGSDVNALYMVNEILVISNNILYVIDNSLQLDWSYQFKYRDMAVKNIHWISSIDLDDNGCEDLIIASDGMVYDYEIAGAFIKQQSAERYYELGREAYELDRYSEAKSYIERAKQLYLELDLTDAVSGCDSLLEKINGEMAGDRRAEADSQYARALIYYSVKDYEPARKHIQNARDIYMEIGDSDGVLSCDELIATIDSILSRANTTTSTSITSPAVTSTTTVRGGSDSSSSLSNPLLIVGILVITSILFVFLRRRRAPKSSKKVEAPEPREEEPGEERLLEGWEDLDKKWKELEED